MVHPARWSQADMVIADDPAESVDPAHVCCTGLDDGSVFMDNIPAPQAAQLLVIGKVLLDACEPIRMRRGIIIGNRDDVAGSVSKALIEGLDHSRLSYIHHVQPGPVIPLFQQLMRLLIKVACDDDHLIGRTRLRGQGGQAAAEILWALKCGNEY